VLELPPAPDPAVSIVVAAARDPDRLVRCLDAVARAADRPYEVVVVLDAAEPGFAERLDAQVRGARVVGSDVPLGFAGGVRLGMRQARAGLLHVLHDDTEVCPGWLGALADALEAHPEAGAAGSRILDLDGGFQGAGHIVWRDGTTSPLPPPAESDAAFPVDYCASASLLIRREAWEATGGFDPEFHPAYYVDVDIAMALRAHGYVMLCEPASRVCHQRGGSTRQAFRNFVSARNRERFVAKWEADLAHQAPPGEPLERARRATELRAAAVATAPRPAPAEPHDDDPRRQRERDAAVKDAFIAHAEGLIAELAATCERLQTDGAVAQAALGELHEEHAALHGHYAELARGLEDERAARAAAEARLAGLDGARPGVRATLTRIRSRAAARVRRRRSRAAARVRRRRAG
jgi:GT2 family glycosyltransferase